MNEWIWRILIYSWNWEWWELIVKLIQGWFNSWFVSWLGLKICSSLTHIPYKCRLLCRQCNFDNGKGMNEWRTCKYYKVHKNMVTLVKICDFDLIEMHENLSFISDMRRGETWHDRVWICHAVWNMRKKNPVVLDVVVSIVFVWPSAYNCYKVKWSESMENGG